MAPALERVVLPQVETIIEAVRRCVIGNVAKAVSGEAR
jgi:hypothetical protein